MKICGISDIHGNLIGNIPECDVLCICGDTITLNAQRNNKESGHWWTKRFTKWANRQSCKKILVIPGNHDFYLEYLYKEDKFNAFKSLMRDLTDNKVEFLIDESYDYEGILFYGTPWIKPIMFQEDRWAFSSQDHFEDIPYCDVLLTHDSPIHNKVLDHYCYGKYRKYHLYGHWHDGPNNVTVGQYNCSRLNDCYSFKQDYEFIVLDIMTEKEKKQVEKNLIEELLVDAQERTNSSEECAIVTHFLKGVLDTFYKEPELQQDIEDSVIWDTNASIEISDSSLITDIED